MSGTLSDRTASGVPMPSRSGADGIGVDETATPPRTEIFQGKEVTEAHHFYVKPRAAQVRAQEPSKTLLIPLPQGKVDLPIPDGVCRWGPDFRLAGDHELRTLNPSRTRCRCLLGD